MKKFDLIAIGNISIDTIEIENKKHTVPGGSAGAVLTASAARDLSTGLVARIGEDFKKEWLEDLSSRGINLDGILKQKVSCRFELSYDSKGNLKKFNEIFSHEAFSVKDIPKSYFETKHLHLSAAHPKNQEKILNSLKSSKFTLSLALWPKYELEYTEDFIKLLKKIKILFCNDYEALMLTKEENVYDAAKKIQNFGPEILVLTKGSKGSAIYSKNEFYLFPALRTSKIDTTGCGDSFAGGFLAEYIKGTGIERAGWVGTALASFTMSKIGSWFPKVEKERIEERIERAQKYSEKGTKSTLLDFF